MISSVLVLPSFPLLGDTDLSVCTFILCSRNLFISGVDKCFPFVRNVSYFKPVEKTLYGIFIYDDTYY